MDNPHATDAPTRQERRDAIENRERLLATAKQFFAAQGIDATSMYEIARAAGVGQGTLYRHFADKGEICHALIKEDLAAFMERVGAMIGGGAGTTPLARLDMLIAEKNLLTESHLPLFAAMDEAAAGARRAKPFRGPFHTWLHEQISMLLTEAIALGEVAALDVAFTADAILAAGAPPLYHYQRHELGYSGERITAGMRRLFIDGLRRDAVA
jgi:AcrR family transcriptional regulator